MRVLIVNKFLYPRGGDCIVALNTASLLRRHGHEVRFYAMDYPDNLPLPDAAGYASRVDFGAGILAKLSAARRIAGRGDIRASFRKVMLDFRPDVVHLHNIHSYLSPAVGEIASSMGVRVVWTQHDFKLICPAYTCRRPDGTNCELCFAGKPRAARHRCLKGSLPASLMADMEARIWNRRRILRFTSAIICPSQFMASRLEKAGYDKDRLHVLCNFADPAKYEGHTPCAEPQPYFCYIGRLSEEKGVATLLRAAHIAGVHLKVAGSGPLEEELRKHYLHVPEIEFLGHLDAGGVAATLQNAAASVIPSECYENNPLGVIESLSMGTPVIGADIGGIPELLRPEALDGLRHGESYPSRDAHALASALRSFSPEAYERAEIARRARHAFSPDTHYSRLMKIYSPE